VEIPHLEWLTDLGESCKILYNDIWVRLSRGALYVMYKRVDHPRYQVQKTAPIDGQDVSTSFSIASLPQIQRVLAAPSSDSLSFLTQRLGPTTSFLPSIL
jgi:hypothetical protein